MAAELWPEADFADVVSLRRAQRVSAKELNNRPGSVVHDAVREHVVVVQNHGYDVAAIVNINYLRWLQQTVERLGSAEERQ